MVKPCLVDTHLSYKVCVQSFRMWFQIWHSKEYRMTLQEKSISFDIYKIIYLFSRGWCAMQIKINKCKYNTKEIDKES